MALATPIVGWVALPLYDRTVAALRRRRGNMFALASLGVLTAYVYSAVVTILGRGFVYFEAAAAIVTLVLLVLAVLSVVYLTRAISRGAETAKQVTAVSGGSDGEPPTTGASGDGGGRLAGLSWRWNPQSLFTLLLLAVGVFFLVESLQFRYPHTRFAPFYLSIALMAAVALQLVGEGLNRRRQGEIMDLGMRSGTGGAAFRKLLVVAAWLAMRPTRAGAR